MDRLTAVVTLASYAQPLLVKGELDKISVPVMVQGGGKDMIAPDDRQERVYYKIKAHGCKIIYPDAAHLTWTALYAQGMHHAATAEAAAGFLTAAFAGRTPTAADLPSPSVPAATKCK